MVEVEVEDSVGFERCTVLDKTNLKLAGFLQHLVSCNLGKDVTPFLRGSKIQRQRLGAWW